MFFNKKKNDIVSPYKGKYIKLENVNDPAFSSKAMGDGFAVDLVSGDIKSPIDGSVMMCFPTKHAFGLIDDKGTEYLLHIGIDTVTLEGNGFECLVTESQKIKKGDMLCKADLEYLKENNISAVSMFIVTNKDVKHIFKGSEVDFGTGDIITVK